MHMVTHAQSEITKLTILGRVGVGCGVVSCLVGIDFSGIPDCCCIPFLFILALNLWNGYAHACNALSY